MMKDNSSCKAEQNASRQQCVSPQHVLAFYTIMTILLKIKKEQGLESMLEYMSNFIATVDLSTPQLSQALARTIQHISTGVIYDELGKFPNKNN